MYNSVGHSRKSRQLAIASSEAQTGKEYIVSFVLIQLLHLDCIADAIGGLEEVTNITVAYRYARCIVNIEDADIIC